MLALNGGMIALLITVGICAGFAKTGVSTMNILNVMLMSQVLPAKDAVGLLLPILILADIIAVTYYRRNVKWRLMLSLAPWVLVGLGAGYVVLLFTTDRHLQVLLGTIIGALILLQLFRDKWGFRWEESLPRSVWFTALMGAVAGFATMIGNVSGVVMAIYLMVKKLSKQEIVGTGAWFFLAVNLIKTPFYIQLGMITWSSASVAVWVIPAIAAGAYLGIKLVPLIPQKWFQMIILLLGAVGAFRLIIG